MDNELLVINTYIALAKGQLNNEFAKILHLDRNVYLEKKVVPQKGNAFPIDIIFFSRKYSMFLLLEVKNASSTDLNKTQAEAYFNITGESLKDIGFTFEKNTVNIHVSYTSTEETAEHTKKILRDDGFEYPVLCLYKDKLSIGYYDEKHFSYAILDNVFAKGVSLEIKDLCEIPPYVKIGLQTPSSTIASYVLPELVSINSKTKAAATLDDLCRHSFSTSPKLWEMLSIDFRKAIQAKIRDTLRLCEKMFLKGRLIEKSGKWQLDFFDSSGQINAQKLNATKKAISDGGRELDLFNVLPLEFGAYDNTSAEISATSSTVNP